MKTILSVFAAFLFLNINAEVRVADKNSDLAYLIQDYILISKWDAVSNTWIKSTNQVAIYNDNNILVHSLVLDANTNDTISRISYYYNEDGLMAEQRSQVWVAGDWVDKYKLLTVYDDERRRSSIVTYLWTNNEWILAARQHYLTYNEDKELLSFYSQYWINNVWGSTSIDYYEYDSLSNMVYQVRKDIGGIFSYQAFYTYLNGNMLTRFVQNWLKSTNTWVNNYRDTYQYNSCSTRMQYIRERFISGNWINEQKTEYFYKIAFHKFDKNRKVAVCHKGNTIYISVNALKAHLAHGDCIGECTVEKKPEKRNFEEKEKPRTPPFTIYPNPAKEKITIKFNRDECKESKRVELTDFNGKIIRSFNVKDNGDLIIYRGNLISGKYCVKLVGKEVYSAVVIFE